MSNAIPSDGYRNHEVSDPSLDLMLDLIKALLQQLEETLNGIPDQTNIGLSTFTLNLFKDDSERMRQSISDEHALISNLVQSLRVSMAAFDDLAKPEAKEHIVELSSKLEPLIRRFQDRAGELGDWLDDMDKSIVKHQKDRAMHLKRLKVLVPICSVSVVATVAVVLIARFQTGAVKP